MQEDHQFCRNLKSPPLPRAYHCSVKPGWDRTRLGPFVNLRNIYSPRTANLRNVFYKLSTGRPEVDHLLDVSQFAHKAT